MVKGSTDDETLLPGPETHRNAVPERWSRWVSWVAEHWSWKQETSATTRSTLYSKDCPVLKVVYLFSHQHYLHLSLIFLCSLCILKTSINWGKLSESVFIVIQKGLTYIIMTRSLSGVLNSLFTLSTFWTRLLFVVGALSVCLQDVWQHPLPLPTRCR